MSITVDKLLTKVEAIQRFVADRSSQDREYINFDQTLKDLSECLKRRQLTLQIIGHDLGQIQALQKLLQSNSDLQEIYRVKGSTLPEIPDLEAPPPSSVLIFEPPTKTQQSLQHELKSAHNQVIGRNPSAVQILLPDHLSLIGGSHAELRFFSDGSWQIRDLGSRNGTFINGNPQKFQDWYSLKDGDLICLGSPFQVEGSTIATFKVPSTEKDHLTLAETQKLLDCNILCLVVPFPSLSDNIHRFIQLVKNTSFAKILIVVNNPENINNDNFRENLTTIKKSLANQLQNISFELVSLLLQPFTPSCGATTITPHSQPEFEEFCNNLKDITTETSEVILAEWATNKLNQIIDRIEENLVRQSIAFQEKIKNDEERFKEISQGNLKKQIEKVYKKVDGERDNFFKQVKTELGQSKASLLDEFRKNSIYSRIEQFASQLQPQVSDKGSYRYICLKLGVRYYTKENYTNDVHAEAIELCHSELTQWATEEWNQILNEYVSGGLDTFFEKNYESLNFIPKLMIPKEEFSISQTLNIQSVLNISNVKPIVELKYKKVKFWDYLLKSIRTNFMNIAYIATPLSALGVAIISFFKIELVIQKAAIVVVCNLFLLPFIIFSAFNSYKREEEFKIDESSEKLQKDIVSYYQSYVKSLVDRIVQRIGGLLETEERNFRETLENVKEIYASHLAEVDKKQSQLKSELDEMKRSGQPKIDKELAEFRKLKQSV